MKPLEISEISSELHFLTINYYEKRMEDSKR